MYDVTIPSKRYPDLHYTGEDDPLYECAWSPGSDEVFTVHLFPEVAADQQAVALMGAFLDHIEEMDKKARQAIEQAITQEDSPDHETVAYFLQYYFEEDYPQDELQELFMTEQNPHSLNPVELLRLLNFRHLFTWRDAQNEQFFSMDYMYNPDMTDEILTLVVDKNFEIVSIANES